MAADTEEEPDTAEQMVGSMLGQEVEVQAVAHREEEEEEELVLELMLEWDPLP